MTRPRAHAPPRSPVALACAALLACQRAPAPPAPDPPVDPGAEHIVELTPEGALNARVQTARLTPETFVPRLTTAGAITADAHHLARVGSRVNGRVVNVLVRLGDAVTRGQPLVEIDTVELHQVAQEYLTAVARMREAEDLVARARALAAQRVDSEEALRRREADAAVAAAALHEAEEHLHVLGLTERDIQRLRARTTHGESRSRVRAPIAGRVVALDVTLGQVLSGDEAIVTIARLDTVWATLQVYERDIGRLAQGAAVEVRVPGFPGRVFPGTLTFVGDLVDPATRTLEARAELRNPDGALRPGMSAVATINARGAPPTLALPVEAVQPLEGGRVVFVRIGERRFQARPVTVGDEGGGVVPVETGVAPGDEVVVRGAFALRAELEREELEED